MWVSFPLFIKNVTHWLARPGGIQKLDFFRTGETFRQTFSQDITAATVETPSGSKESPPLSGTRGVYYSQTDRVGVYQLSAGGTTIPFAVNLLSSAESDNAARDSIRLGEEVVEAKEEKAEQHTELWLYAVLAALLFLLGEWHLYNRRILG